MYQDGKTEWITDDEMMISTCIQDYNCIKIVELFPSRFGRPMWKKYKS